MRVHAIIDFMPLFFKYKFRVESDKRGQFKKLTHVDEINGLNFVRDVTLIYHVLREIELIRADLLKRSPDAELVVSICTDRKSKRKEMSDGTDYKKNRKELTAEELESIDITLELLGKAGYNMYAADGYEADDFVNALCARYKDKFDVSIVYTNDKDLLVNICDKVAAMRYKVNTGKWDVITNKNYSSYLSKEFDADIRFNGIVLYLSTVGDNADGIKGIFNFGSRAFDKLVKYLDTKGVDWEKMGCADYMESTFPLVKEYLNSDEKYNQFINSYGLVKAVDFDIDVEEPVKHDEKNKRIESYSRFEMVSLYN